MMALDALNNLNQFPLNNIDVFINKCIEKGVQEINITGTNTDPLIYSHHRELCETLKTNIKGCKLGIRTNGVLAIEKKYVWDLYDKVSFSITSFDRAIYLKTMGKGLPPSIESIMDIVKIPIKINIVLCPEILTNGDIFRTLDKLQTIGIKRVNIREPYGQPHIGSPLKDPYKFIYGMPCYKYYDMDVVYWDVHYVEVESINLYANGKVSEDYPVTRGHVSNGEVISQEKWSYGRHFNQWANL
jgi:hypothetical protein